MPVATPARPDETPIGTGRGNRSVGARASMIPVTTLSTSTPSSDEGNARDAAFLLVDLDDRLAGVVQGDGDADDARHVQQLLGVPLLDRDRDGEAGRAAARRPLALPRRRRREGDGDERREEQSCADPTEHPDLISR